MGSLEKGIVFAPNNDEGRREDLEDTTSNDYFDLIDTYNAKFSQMKGLIGRRANPRVEETIQRLDLERHDIHVKLGEIGSKLGKDANDVIADIIERSGDLREYGLPEFSLMTHHESSPPFFFGSEIGQDEAVLVFDTIYFDGNFRSRKKYFQGGQKYALYSPDATIRQSRAETLAQTLETSVATLKNSRFFHSNDLNRIGVVLKTAKLEESLALIREQPQKYRLLEDFYSPEELKEADASFQKHCKDIWDTWARDEYYSYLFGDSKDYSYSSSENDEEYERAVSEGIESVDLKIKSSIEDNIERTKNDFGDRAASVAQKAYEEWRSDRVK